MKFLRIYFVVGGLLLCSVTQSIYAHAGPHERSCELSVGKVNLRISGYQLQSKLPERHYCRIYPELGKLNLQIDSVDSDLSAYQVELKLLTITSWSDAITNPFNIFNQVISSVPGYIDDEGKIIFTTEIVKVAPYSLEIILSQAGKNPQSNRFMFFVGVPVAKILVIFCGFLLLSLMVSLIKQSFQRKQKTG